MYILTNSSGGRSKHKTKKLMKCMGDATTHKINRLLDQYSSSRMQQKEDLDGFDRIQINQKPQQKQLTVCTANQKLSSTFVKNNLRLLFGPRSSWLHIIGKASTTGSGGRNIPDFHHIDGAAHKDLEPFVVEDLAKCCDFRRCGIRGAAKCVLHTLHIKRKTLANGF